MRHKLQFYLENSLLLSGIPRSRLGEVGQLTIMYYVYMIRNEVDETIYTGMTQNLKRRLLEHNAKKVRHTKLKTPWKLAWYCVFDSNDKASSFEKYLKSSSGFAFRNKRLL